MIELDIRDGHWQPKNIQYKNTMSVNKDIVIDFPEMLFVNNSFVINSLFPSSFRYRLLSNLRLKSKFKYWLIAPCSLISTCNLASV